MKTQDDFYNIIKKCLKERDNCKGRSPHDPSDEDKNIPRYIMEMCKKINEEMPTPILEKILSWEGHDSGHIDYHQKFALHCYRLYKDALGEK